MASMPKANKDENGNQTEESTTVDKKLIDDNDGNEKLDYSLLMDMPGISSYYEQFGCYTTARLCPCCREKVKAMDEQVQAFIIEAIKNNLGPNEIKTRMKAFEDEYIAILEMLTAKKEASDADNDEAIDNEMDEVDSASVSENDESGSHDTSKAAAIRPKLPRFEFIEEQDPAYAPLDINMVRDLIGGAAMPSRLQYLNMERSVISYAEIKARSDERLNMWIAELDKLEKESKNEDTKDEDAKDLEENEMEAEEIV